MRGMSARRVKSGWPPETTSIGMGSGMPIVWRTMSHARRAGMSDTETQARAQHLERRLATILCADVAGYSRMMGENEERTVRVFRGHREIFETLVSQHRGRIFNTAGDALLAEFSSAVEAVRCA